MNLKQFQKKMRKKFSKASRRDIRLLVSAFVILAVSVFYSIDKFFLPVAQGTKVGFKSADNTIMIIMAAMILLSLGIILYFGTRYQE